MKTMSSGAGAMFMKKRTPEPELCHFYDGSAALRLEADKLKISCSRVIAANKSVWVKGGLGQARNQGGIWGICTPRNFRNIA